MREISTVRSESVRLIENAWVSREMRETWQVCIFALFFMLHSAYLSRINLIWFDYAQYEDISESNFKTRLYTISENSNIFLTDIHHAHCRHSLSPASVFHAFPTVNRPPCSRLLKNLIQTPTGQTKPTMFWEKMFAWYNEKEIQEKSCMYTARNKSVIQRIHEFTGIERQFFDYDISVSPEGASRLRRR